MNAECEMCGAEITHRLVTFKLPIGGTLHFCGDLCELRWMRAELARERRALHAIALGGRKNGFERELASRVLGRSLSHGSRT